MVIIRLARFGRKNDPVYKIMVAEKGAKVTGRHLDKLGFFKPGAPPQFQFNVERYSFWISKGAQPTTTLKSVLRKNKVDLTATPAATASAPAAAKAPAAKAAKAAAPAAAKKSAPKKK